MGAWALTPHCGAYRRVWDPRDVWMGAYLRIGINNVTDSVRLNSMKMIYETSFVDEANM